jgi:hypothetical protein
VTQLLGSALIVAAAVIALSAALLYGTCFRWSRSHEGRHLFWYQLVIGMVLVVWVGRLGYMGALAPHPDTTVWDYLRLGAFVLIDWVLGWRLLILVRSWPMERRRRQAEEERC